MAVLIVLIVTPPLGFTSSGTRDDVKYKDDVPGLGFFVGLWVGFFPGFRVGLKLTLFEGAAVTGLGTGAETGVLGEAEGLGTGARLGA